jgi:hypothetical protein
MASARRNLHDKSVVVDPKMNDKSELKQFLWNPDEPLLEGDEGRALTLLEFCSDCGERDWGTKGLFLKDVEDSIFSRKGTFECITSIARQSRKVSRARGKEPIRSTVSLSIVYPG